DYCKIPSDARHCLLYTCIGVYCILVLDEYSNDNTFPDIWIIAKYIDRSLEFSIAPWL
ncbi:unnamed protein product, partial [Rotaria sp. Silwood2]